MKFLALSIFFSTILQVAYGQTEIENSEFRKDQKKKRSYMNLDEIHGYYVTSGEIYSLDADYFSQLIKREDTPKVELESAGLLGWIAYMRNRMFYNVSYSTIMKKEASIDSLGVKSKLKQSSIAIKCGYNLLTKEWVIISPYVGFRMFRFRHLTSRTNSRITIEDYINQPNIDLRVTQFSVVGGLNVTFNYKNHISYGFYVDYVQNLHKIPIVRTKGDRLRTNVQSPVNQLLIGIGMGIGLN